ncbi:hypothetical protein D3C79_819230 [compost metagenome]
MLTGLQFDLGLGEGRAQGPAVRVGGHVLFIQGGGPFGGLAQPGEGQQGVIDAQAAIFAETRLGGALVAAVDAQADLLAPRREARLPAEQSGKFRVDTALAQYLLVEHAVLRRGGFIGRARRLESLKAQQGETQPQYQLLARTGFANGINDDLHRMLAS